MTLERERKPGGSTLSQRAPSADVVGKSTLTESLQKREAGKPAEPTKSAPPGPDGPTLAMGLEADEWSAVQMRSEQSAAAAADPDDVHQSAAAGVSGTSGALPHMDRIQSSFGHHDVSGVEAHTDGAAAQASAAMGAEAFATGSHVAFSSGTPSLHTAAHEAAHVVQQRGGVQLKGGVGEVGDPYEQHADAVADRVVAGQSAEALLDGAVGGASPMTRASSGTEHVQRLAASDIAAEHFVDNRVFTTSSTPKMSGPAPLYGPTPGVELFSGFTWAEMKYDATLSDDVRTMIQQSAPQGEGGLAGGTPSSYARGKFENDHPDVAKKYALTWNVGPASNVVSETRTTADFVDSLMGGLPPAAATGIRYSREAATDVWTSFLGAGPYVHMTGKELSLQGKRELTTKGDGQLLVKLSSKLLPNPWTDLMLRDDQVYEFVQVFQATTPSATVKQVWYAWATTGLMEGSAANPKAWIKKTHSQTAMHRSLINSLQSLHQAGFAAADADLKRYVEGLRAVIDDASTDAAAKQQLQHLLVASNLWSETSVTNADFATKGETPEAPKSNYDTMRLAGKLLANEQIVPRLQMSKLDPEKFLSRYTSKDEGQAPVSDLMNEVVLDALVLSKMISAFFDSMHPRDLGLAQPPDGVTTASALQVDAAKMGAAEEIRNAGVATNGDFAALSIQLGIQRGLAELTKGSKDGTSDSPVGLFTVLNNATTKMADILEHEGSLLEEKGERLTHSDGKEKKSLGANLKDLGSRFKARATFQDLVALRGTLGAVTVSLVKDGTLHDIEVYLANQAAIATTNVHLAFETAWVRYLDELKTSVRGKIASKKSGGVFVPGTLLTLKTSKEILGLVKEGKEVMKLMGMGAGASKALRLAGPTLAVVGVAIDVVTFFHNWYVKNKLKHLEKELIADADKQMESFKSGVVAKMDAQASAEHKHYAKGQVRSADDMQAYISALANGQAGSPGTMIDLTAQDPDVLKGFYDAAINAEPIPYAQISAAQTEAVALNANSLWQYYEQRMDDVGDTW
jgi:hypothetical protein